MEDIDGLFRILRDHSQFGDSVEELYLNHWEEIRNTESVIFFGIISRLRSFIDFKWILEEFGLSKISLLKKFLHYFRKEGTRLYFYDDGKQIRQKLYLYSNLAESRVYGGTNECM